MYQIAPVRNILKASSLDRFLIGHRVSVICLWFCFEEENTRVLLNNIWISIRKKRGRKTSENQTCIIPYGSAFKNRGGTVQQ